MLFYEICKFARMRKKIKREDVAKSCNYSVENIISFELGRVNNARIYDYYIKNILDERDIKELRNEY